MVLFKNAVYKLKTYKLKYFLINKNLNTFNYLAPSLIKLYMPKKMNENEEIEILCLFSDDGNPRTKEIKFQIGNKSYIKKAVRSFSFD